jgi:hypothetical protein
VETNGKKFLTAAEIREVQDVETVVVDIPEWGGAIRLKALTGEEAVEFSESIKEGDKSGAARLVARCAVDEDGNRIFADADIDVLKQKSMKALLRAQNVAMKLNGLTEESKETAKNA